eukprot:6098779-Prymnesium_polylepis.2
MRAPLGALRRDGSETRGAHTRRNSAAGSNMSDPAYLKALKGQMPIQKMGWFMNYKKAFIDTSKFTP